MENNNDKIREGIAESSKKVKKGAGSRKSDQLKLPSKIRCEQGVVVQKSGNKTVRVKVVTVSRHHLYHKRIVKTKSYLVHDEANYAKPGESVEIMGCSPKSKRKRWTLVRGKMQNEKRKITTKNIKKPSPEATE